MASTYETLKKGSTGDSVVQLQKALINAGYSVGSAGADGIYGSNTAAAVKAYQQANGLTVDGIAGSQTLGSLYGSGTTASSPSSSASTVSPYLTGVSQGTTEALNSYESGYTPSQDVTDAQNYLDSVRDGKPGDYKSGYEQQLDEIWNSIMNKEPFSYDPMSDVLFQQYMTNYVNQGRTAMEDASGQAAALTGGYGSTYSQAAGQQVFNQYLQQMNEVIPELYSLARDNYDSDLNQLYSLYGLAADRDSADYSRWRDSVSDWYNDMSLAYGEYSDARDTDYNRWLNQINYYQNKAQLENSDYWTQKNYDLSLDQWEWQKKNSSSGSVTSGGGGGGGYDNQGYNSELIIRAQKLVGATPDGKWGSNSEAAAIAMGYNSLDEVINAVVQNASTPDQYVSGFSQTTGVYRFENPGKLLDAKGLEALNYSIGMCRSEAGRCALIDDALNEGKITNAQSTALLNKWGISFEDFKKIRGYN